MFMLFAGENEQNTSWTVFVDETPGITSQPFLDNLEGCFRSEHVALWSGGLKDPGLKKFEP